MTIKNETQIGTTEKTRATVALREVEGGFEVVRRKAAKGSRWVVLFPKAPEAKALASLNSVVKLAGYWAGSASESYFASVESGREVVIKVG